MRPIDADIFIKVLRANQQDIMKSSKYSAQEKERLYGFYDIMIEVMEKIPTIDTATLSYYILRQEGVL